MAKRADETSRSAHERDEETQVRGRRAFLQAGLVAATAAALPAAAAQAQPDASSSSPAPTCSSDPATDEPPCGCGPMAPGDEPTPIDPSNAFETWNEPWVWRPGDWPGQQLDMHVVENQNPGIEVGLGNPGSVIFSYGGNTPGPTIRMRGDETLFVKLRNLLGQNLGSTKIGPNPDTAATVPWLKPADIPFDTRDDFCLGEHTNGVHAVHTTNLHTHGLHVRPDRNPNGTHSDNVILRVMPQADLIRREQNDETANCEFLRMPDELYFMRQDETAGQADYEFRLGDVMGDPDQPHPPGTHWYHPHCHGATHNQVASGMAGFLIVEGDVDASVNRYFTGEDAPDPIEKTGDFDYRERLMFMQRVNTGNISKDPDAANPEIRRPQVLPLVNGSNHPSMITMRPGAVERWRVLNGSVDGRGYKHFMVVEGQYEVVTITEGRNKGDRLCKIAPDGSATCVTFSDLEPYDGPSPKQPLYQLAFDGITMVTPDGRYTIRDLTKQNAGTRNPLAAPLTGSRNPNVCLLRNLESVFANPESIRNTWTRPNEVYLGPANRSDVFFEAPRDGAGKVFTVLAKAALIHADTPLQSLQQNVHKNGDKETVLFPGPTDIVMAHVVVKGDPVAGRFDLDALRALLPDVPPYLKPVAKAELELTPVERSAQKKKTGREPKRYRTRTIRYSGVGAQGFPLFVAPDAETAKFPELNKLLYAASPEKDSPTKLFMSPDLKTMAIDGRKFSPGDPNRPRAYVIVDEARDGGHAAEEWAIFNESPTLWGNTTTRRAETGGPQGDPRTTDYRQPSYQYSAHYVSYPLSRREGFDAYANNTEFQVVTRAIDHPFHQHQNPFYVMRIEIPDADGNLVNILPEPRWQDVVWIPRNGGRVVFRSRFPDFVGSWVNHCHLLLHEDNGMMQVVQGTPFADEANYTTADRVAEGGLTPPDRTDALYPPPARDEVYRRSLAFVDPNHASGQQFPLPSYFDKMGNLIESMIPVPELPPEDADG